MAEPDISAITAENARLRRENQQLLATVAGIIEAGLAGLDRHDGDPDLDGDNDAEPDDDAEPSLGAAEKVDEG